jgi:hypothetical protein
MNLPRWIFIPVYGAVRGFSEHHAICAAHSRAYKHNDYDSMNELYEQSWSAMDRATAGLWITVAELIALVLVGYAIASFFV